TAGGRERTDRAASVQSVRNGTAGLRFGGPGTARLLLRGGRRRRVPGRGGAIGAAAGAPFRRGVPGPRADGERRGRPGSAGRCPRTAGAARPASRRAPP